VGRTPAAGLRSTRDKPDAEYCARIFTVLKAHDVRWFFYIGGNDSADTCLIVEEEAAKAGYDLKVAHVPKTIDNDLKVTDHCPGFGSAAKFVAQAFAGVNLDNRAIPGVYIGVVMGRDAGFLTAASALGRRYADDGPHLIYVPERPLDGERFVSEVRNVFDRCGRCIVAMSEGVRGEGGKPIASMFTGGEKDAHGNIQLSGSGMLGDLAASWIRRGTEIKRVRADTLGYLQRSFLGCVSETDRREAREVGIRAVRFSVGGNRSGSVAILRTGDYEVDYELVELSAVARHTKSMPDEFINQAGNDVTQAFLDYARPLAGDLPEVLRLDAPRVEKILGS